MIELKQFLNRKLGYNISLLILIVFIGSILRFINLDGKSFNFDESVTVWESYFLSDKLIKYVNLCEGTPFLFPLVIGIVNQINESEFFLRLLPCIFGILSIIIIYFLSKDFMSAKAALISSLLVSLSSIQVTKSQEIRYCNATTLASTF